MEHMDAAHGHKSAAHGCTDAARSSPCRDVAAIYVIQLAASDGEYFTKVGITSKYDPEASNPFEGLAARARGFYPYTVAACEVRVGTPDEVLEVERSMLNVLRSVKGNLYKPEVAFKGSKTECFRLAYVKMKRLLQSQWDCRNALMS